MSRPTERRRTVWPGLVLAGAVLLAITGCREHLDRRDTLTRASGNALQLNAATHRIDPWPPEAWRTTETRPGKRAAHVIEEYYKPSEAKASQDADGKYSTTE